MNSFIQPTQSCNTCIQSQEKPKCESCTRTICQELQTCFNNKNVIIPHNAIMPGPDGWVLGFVNGSVIPVPMVAGGPTACDDVITCLSSGTYNASLNTLIGDYLQSSGEAVVNSIISNYISSPAGCTAVNSCISPTPGIDICAGVTSCIETNTTVRATLNQFIDEYFVDNIDFDEIIHEYLVSSEGCTDISACVSTETPSRYIDSTSKTQTNPSGSQTLYSITIPANTVNKGLDLELSEYFNNITASTETVYLELYLDGNYIGIISMLTANPVSIRTANVKLLGFLEGNTLKITTNNYFSTTFDKTVSHILEIRSTINTAGVGSTVTSHGLIINYF